MQWFIIIQIVLSFLYVAYLIYSYALPSVSWFVKVSVYLTWLLCFSTVVLLPFDIYQSLQKDQGMAIMWRSIYAFIFFLTWVLLPIAQEYQTAGEFSVMQKLKRAIINNLIIYGIFAFIGLLFLGYLIFQGKVNLGTLAPILMAVSNAFGMFLVVIFLSYGLITVPKSLWRYRKYEIKLKEHQFSASQLTQKKQIILHELELRVKEILWQIKQKGETPETIQILNIVPAELREKWSKKVANLGHVNVVKIHKEIKELTLELSRIESRWEHISIQAFKIEDILTYMNASNRRIDSTIFPQYQNQFFNYMQWVWNCRMKLYLTPVLSIIFAIFAVTIIVAELASFIPSINVINPFRHLTQLSSFFTMDFLLLILMAYMAFCVYYALFKLKFSNFYGLYWNKQTDSASLIFFAINCSRVSNALCYNFLQVIDDDETSFLRVMGDTKVVPVFGNIFQFLFPILLITLILFNACDVYSRVCKRLNLNKFQFQNEFSHENIDQGRKLLQKARAELETKILNSNCHSLQEFRSYKSQSGGVGTIQSMNKDNSSSETLHLQNKYFNEYPDMQKVAKIFDM